MIDRNEKREIFINENQLYKKCLRKRGIKSFRHYSRMTFGSLSSQDLSDMTVVDHYWKTGDSLYKLASKYYGHLRYWWVIAWFNKKPINNMYKMGDTVHIPLPLEDALYHVTKDD